MTDRDCVRFLQWALPRLHLRWPGFRRVRRQVCRRVDRRIHELGLRNVEEYRAFLTEHDAEWRHLSSLCRITISRFYRDRDVFDFIRRELLPELVKRAGAESRNAIDCWSAGCASGEEPYTLALIWGLEISLRFPGLRLDILATDIDEELLERARFACYRWSSLKELPAGWLEQAFSRQPDGTYRLAERFRTVSFQTGDIRREAPSRRFHLILCRNLVFTYFDESLRIETLSRIRDHLYPGGFLVLGRRETVPEETKGLSPVDGARGIYREGD